MVLAEDLRQVVVQEAIQGKLTKQFKSDSSVDVLLQEIKQEKIRFMKENKRKVEPELAIYDEENVPFDIPDNWRWCQLGQIISYQNGYAYKSSDMVKGGKGYPVIKSQNLMTLKVVIKEENDRIETPNEKMLSCKIEKNDLLMCLSSQSSNPEPLGKTAIYEFDEPALLNQRVLKMTLVNLDMLYYIFYVINSAYFHYNISHKGDGSAQSNLKLEHVREMLIPIPPIEEQQRIVDKINEIMHKIDEYEIIEKKLKVLKKEFPANMKDALLQAAMQGKLTGQLESDSSVDELLEAIRKEKEELIAQKKIKKEKPLSDIEEEEIPFDIPENWRWVRLGNVGTLTRGNGIKRNEVTEVGFPCVRYGELYTTYKTKFDVAVSHTSKEIFNKSQKVHTNDILMALTGENNFDIALALAYLGEEVIAMGGDLTRWSNHHMNPLYLVYVMNSSYAIHKKSEMAKGDIIVHISNDKLATILLPIPPIEEQNRIVERLEALLPLCEDLREV